MTSPGKTTLETADIKAILPHREPFLFVDRIVEMSPTRIVGTKRLSGSEAFFKGHFPGQPIMPGVLMIEALAQTGGVLVLSSAQKRGKIAYLMSVDNARFRKVVRPGDEIRLEVDVVRLKSRIGLVHGVVKVGGEEVCNADIMFSLAE